METKNSSSPERRDEKQNDWVNFAPITAVLAFAGMVFSADRNALTAGEEIKVSSIPGLSHMTDGGFPRSGGLVKINERDIWTFQTDAGKSVALDARVGSVAKGDTIHVSEVHPIWSREIKKATIEHR